MPIRIAHLNLYRTLPMDHCGPFDGMLVAQARAEALTLISWDPDIAKNDVAVLCCSGGKSAAAGQVDAFPRLVYPVASIFPNPARVLARIAPLFKSPSRQRVSA